MKLFKNIIRKFIPSTHEIIKNFLRSELSSCKNVLDLGCGERSPLFLIKNDPDFKDLYSVGVDIFSPYILKNLAENKIHSEYINKNIFEIDFPENSFDCAMLFDVIEHFDRDDFLKFLPRLEQIVKKILIITPNGFVEQEVYDDNPYQIPGSGWTVEDFEKLGFKCFGLSGLKSIQI
jgi:ubiquinone/menaquinone biosynthesis C-methylase UbiE